MKQLSIKNLILGEGMPKICIPLVSTNENSLLADAAALAPLPADLTEWRADFIDGILKEGEVSRLLTLLKSVTGSLPLLFTFRTFKEGGNLPADIKDYLALTMEAIRSGIPDLVDIELFTGEEEVKALIEAAHSRGIKVVLSNHDFKATPAEEEIFSRLQRMEGLGADIAKIAVMPQCPEDVLTLLSATCRAKKELECPIITMSMDGTGLISRLCGELFGSCITFGCSKKASAPGQLEAGQLRQILELMHQSM